MRKFGSGGVSRSLGGPHRPASLAAPFRLGLARMAGVVAVAVGGCDRYDPSASTEGFREEQAGGDFSIPGRDPGIGGGPRSEPAYGLCCAVQ